MKNESSVSLSIVVAVRNDNYGGDFNTRLQNSINWNITLLEKYGIASEIVLVNWNPVAENPSLSDTLNIPPHTKHVTVRLITVPGYIHHLLSNPQVRFVVPLFEFVAKNAGIHRCRGEYILCTNADVLIHPAIFEFIAANKLKPDQFYRANRLDFSNSESLSEDSMFEMGTVISLKGYPYKFRHGGVSTKLQYRLFKLYNTIRVWWELFRFKHSRLFEKLHVSVTYNNASMYCHCLNCGDFLLMHREHWHHLKGYPETTFISTHTDALFNFMAYVHLGKEYVFSAPIFHQEHERRYGWDSIATEEKFLTMFHFFQQESEKMLKEGKPFIYNSRNWGLNEYELEEELLGRE